MKIAASTTSLQYTIRAVSSELDKALRVQAKRTGKSLNQTALEALERGAGITKKPVVYHDLDWLFGSGGLDSEFDEAMTWLDKAPNDMA